MFLQITLLKYINLKSVIYVRHRGFKKSLGLFVKNYNDYNNNSNLQTLHSSPKYRIGNGISNLIYSNILL